LAQFQQLLDQVTLDEVNQAVRKHMSADNLAIAIVTNDAANLKVQLSEGKSSPITYGAGQTKPEFILAEDKLIADWPLRIQLDTIELLPIDALFQK